MSKDIRHRRVLLTAALALAAVLTLTACELLNGLLPLSAPPRPAAVSEPPTDGFSILFIDVGQADSMLIRCGEEAMLVDGGNVGDSDTIAAVLGKQPGLDRLEYVVCTHAHEDHGGGIAGALHTLPVNHLLAPTADCDSRYFQNMLKAAKEQELEIEIPEPDQAWTLGEATVQVLGPRREYKDTNDTSIVLRITYGDTNFLLTGDMEADAEKDLVEAGCELNADLLKVGHHGSSSSSSYVFLREVMPEYAVISCETGNDYGHPHEETMSRLRDAGVKVYRTDYQGDILAVSDGRTITITTARNQDIETNPATGSKGGTAPYYIGNTSSRKFHRPDCSGLPKKDRQTRFDTRPEAVAAGYAPCGVCKP